jgi:hypothetical protein
VVCILSIQLVSLSVCRSFRGSHLVASFHLRNGACVHAIRWLADTSEKGNQIAFGMMVNYNYLDGYMERLNQAYLVDGRLAVNADDPLLAHTVHNAPSHDTVNIELLHYVRD